ncbi:MULTISPECIES: hypothetical protein [unclassified Methylobacterium]|uniref:hypothetical protein n=1 Tax=unclassified Methylobacterium TaxID=2615210 RepID=UPI00226A1094|nr:MULTISPECIES: hypothetical protein [unclassified Methylobacterium]
MPTTNIGNNPHIITAVIYPADPDAPPPPRVPSSRTIARMREKAEAEACNAAAAQVLARQVQPGLRPPPGRLFATDAAGLVLCGPGGGIGSTERMVRTLAPLAAGGRHPVAVLMTAGGWQDEQALHEALAGLGPKLAALGLRICCRKAGLRIAKARPSKSAP